MKYRVGFIDDEREMIMSLQRKNNGKKFCVNNCDVEIEIIEIPLHSGVDEIIEEINDSKVTAVLVDYLLSNSRSEIHFDGVDIVNKIEEYRMNFPTFILTAQSEEAENCMVDLNKIYTKEDYIKDPHLLNKRIVRQIENHKKRIEEAEKELVDLISRKEKLGVKEENKMMELDAFLEKSYSSNGKIPDILKENKSITMMRELIDAAEDLLKEVKKND